MIRGVPYDAEVEYLESTGTQYIDTGVAINCRTDTVDCRIKVTSVKNYGTAFAVYESIDGGGKNFGVRRDGTQASWQALWGSLPQTLVLDTVYDIHYGYGVNACYINDMTGSSSVTTEFTKPLYIFAFNNLNGANLFNAQCLYSFSIGRNGVLVRDFIPVRFTNELGVSEGAMYDRVTRRLFRNQGTGAFRWGPDVATPVMALHMFQKPPLTTLDYVQDGLVAHWDGIENAGRRVHDDTSACVDLVGDKNLVNGTGHGADWVSFPAGTIVYSDDLSSGSTIELVVGNMSNIENNLWLAVGSAPWGYGLWQSSRRQGGYYIRCGYQAYGGWNLYVRDGYKISACALTQYDSNKHDFYDFGVAVGKGVANPAQANDTCISSRPLLINNSPIALYSLRIYNRILTAAEIAANYAIDKERFKLP